MHLASSHTHIIWPNVYFFKIRYVHWFKFIKCYHGGRQRCLTLSISKIKSQKGVKLSPEQEKQLNDSTFSLLTSLPKLANLSILPYKHSNTGPPEAGLNKKAGWHRGDLQGRLPEVLQRWSPLSLLLTHRTLLCASPHWFWLITAYLMPPYCLLLRHRLCLPPSATGWQQQAYLLCPRPLHCYQCPVDGRSSLMGYLSHSFMSQVSIAQPVKSYM